MNLKIFAERNFIVMSQALLEKDFMNTFEKFTN